MEAIKRIFVVTWQVLQGQYVLHCDGQDLDLVRLLVIHHDLCQRQGETQLAQLELDLDLPDAGDAEQKVLDESRQSARAVFESFSGAVSHQRKVCVSRSSLIWFPSRTRPAAGHRNRH
jgi:hypothetical protein